MPRKGYIWGWAPSNEPVTLDQRERAKLFDFVKSEIEKTTRLKEHVSRINIIKGRVYLYHLVEQMFVEGAIFTKPLIDGKYLEFPLARFTIHDKHLKRCTFDWQRHNDQWMTLGEGTLEECIQQAETSEWLTV